jgi:hypothetical protein
MFRLPLELHLVVFSYLNFKQLLRARAVCRQWRQVILDSSLWPVSVALRSSRSSAKWDIDWPDWIVKEKEQFRLHPETTGQVLLSFSKGCTKSLSVINRMNTPEDICDLLPNFLSLEKLRLQMVSISSRELTSILQRLPQITTFIMFIEKFRGTPMARLKTIQLNLRRLSIHNHPATLNNTVANIVQHSPNLVSLVVRGTVAKKELTMKLGDGIQCLALTINGELPPISARGLKCLMLLISGRLKHKPFEQRPGNLSYLTHLQIYESTAKEQVSIMEAYDIGENLEFLRVTSEPNYDVFLRTPKLKEIRMSDLVPLPLDCCPILQMVGYGSNYEYVDENEREETKLYLESRGITVLRNNYYPDFVEVPSTYDAVDDLSVCYVCGENHT